MPLDRALVFKALADENRLHVVEILAGRGETCACELLDELDVTQPTLSHHMKILRSSGLIASRKEGKWMHYSLVPEKFTELSEMLASVSAHKTDCHCKDNSCSC